MLWGPTLGAKICVGLRREVSARESKVLPWNGECELSLAISAPLAGQWEKIAQAVSERKNNPQQLHAISHI